MDTTTSAPASVCAVVGPVGYQMSSQMFTASTGPPSPSSKIGVSAPAWKYRFSSKTP